MKPKTKVSKRSQASFKQSRVRSDKIASYRYDDKPSVLQKATVSGAAENAADVTLRRLQQGDVFQSAKKTVKQTNSNPQRRNLSHYKGMR